MGKRPKRKIVLFLVEGRSDRNALQNAVSEFYDRIDENIEVFFPVIRDADVDVGGDITSRIGVHPRNIEGKIYEMFLDDFFDENKILPKDIAEIVQIVDTDGVYISDEAVHEGTPPDHNGNVYYGENGLVCANRERIIKRNECKRENLDYLSSLIKIKVRQKSVPYSVYFFSCNLDHFINRDANLEDRLKCSLADAFAKSYIGEAERFVEEITNDPGAVGGTDYKGSWEFIKEGLNSLQRHTNINVLFGILAEKES